MDDIDLDEIHREVIREYSVRPAQQVVDVALRFLITRMCMDDYAALVRHLQQEFPDLDLNMDGLD